MSPTLSVLLFLVALPVLTSAVGLASSWRLYRRITLGCLLLWFLGLGAAVFVEHSCAQGNILYGYSECGSLPDWARLNLTAYGVLAMLGALAVYAAISLAALVRRLMNRDG